MADEVEEELGLYEFGGREPREWWYPEDEDEDGLDFFEDDDSDEEIDTLLHEFEDCEWWDPENGDEDGVDEEDDDNEENTAFGIFDGYQIRGSQVSNRPEEITYDLSLPPEHTYLGSDLEEYSGRTVLDDECCISLPLVQLPGVVLVPGETIPLHLSHPRIISVMKRVLQNNRTFGVLYDCRDSPSSPNGPHSDIGTTAEIFSAKEEDDGGIETMRLKAMGRQRFKVIETRRQADGTLLGQVMILPERNLPDVLCGARRQSLNRTRMVPHNILPSAKDGGVQWLKERRKRHLSEADLTWCPSWVYEMHDPDVLMVKIKNELSGWYENSSQLKQIPAAPSDFSFWVARNMPLDDGQRIGLLKINCAVRRLRRELELLQECTVLCCRECNTQIADKSDIFCMSLDGPMAAYVNPGGYVHETLTIYRAQNYSLEGSPYEENSWFPGYAWTRFQCNSCTSQMGFRFTATERDLKPENFWGLTRSALQTGLQTYEEMQNSSPE